MLAAGGERVRGVDKLIVIGDFFLTELREVDHSRKHALQPLGLGFKHIAHAEVRHAGGAHELPKCSKKCNSPDALLVQLRELELVHGGEVRCLHLLPLERRSNTESAISQKPHPAGQPFLLV